MIAGACSTRRIPDSTERGAATPGPIVVDLPAPPEGKIPPALDAALRSVSPGEYLKIMLEMTEQLDLRALARRLEHEGLVDRLPRRARVLEEMRRLVSARAPFESELAAMQQSGEVDYYAGITIVNRVFVSARPSAIRRLAERPEVRRVIPEHREGGPRAGRDEETPGPPLTNVDLRDRSSWAVEAIGAPSAWARGADGAGIVVGSLDTGVTTDHEQLGPGFRGGVDSWFDPDGGSPDPTDSSGHGTMVLACAVAANVDGWRIGVAPRARWVAALANPSNHYVNTTMTRAADWMGSVARPDVITAAWGHGAGSCDPVDRPLVDALRALEIVVVFPAGNSGPAAGSGESPANLSDLYPGGRSNLSVAATTRAGALAALSGRGPASCSPGSVFPWISAPGQDVLSPLPVGRSAYWISSGTSPAVGFVAGAAALILERCPSMSADAVQSLLADTARDLPPDGHDPGSGYGLVDLRAAFDALDRTCPSAP